jgi:hypothetical protein
VVCGDKPTHQLTKNRGGWGGGGDPAGGDVNDLGYGEEEKNRKAEDAKEGAIRGM